MTKELQNKKKKMHPGMDVAKLFTAVVFCLACQQECCHILDQLHLSERIGACPLGGTP